MSSSVKKYAINTSWILIEKMARIVSGILVGVLVARYLGPEQFGTISYALNLVAIFTVFSTLGMDNVIVRELITRNENRNTILGTSATLKLIGACGAVIAVTYYSFIRDNDQGVLIVFLVSLSLLLQSFNVVDFYFQSIVKGKLLAINQVITLLVSAVVKIFLIYFRAPIEYFASMVLLEATITAINQYIFFKREGENPFLWKFTFTETKELLKQSWPIIITNIAMMIYQKSDQILIKRLLNDDMNGLGNYAAGVRMSEAATFIPVAICAAVFPGIIRNKANPELQRKRLIQLYSLMIWGAFIVIICGQLCGDWVIHFLFKDKFYIAPAIFKIHIWYLIPAFYGCAWGMWLYAQNAQKYFLYFQLPNMAIMMGCYFYFIPRYQIAGAAYAVVTGSYVITFFYIILYKPKESIELLLKALNPINLLDVINLFRLRKEVKEE